MTLTEFYEQVGGSYETAINRLRRDELIKKYLKMFLDDASFAKLDAAVSAKDVTAVFEASHALKGLAANLELTRLFNAASAICEDTRHGSPAGNLDEEMAAVKNEYNLAVASIQEVE